MWVFVVVLVDFFLFVFINPIKDADPIMVKFWPVGMPEKEV